MNDRPIGRHPTHPDDGFYMSPDHLLLGRSGNRLIPLVGLGSKRLNLVECVLNAFWRKWRNNYIADMVVMKKWRTARRNLEVNDVVLVEDANSVRGLWKLGKVAATYPGRDGLVRDVEVAMVKPDGSKSVVSRPVQRLALLLPVEEQ